jgi:hypothetical protein
MRVADDRVFCHRGLVLKSTLALLVLALAPLAVAAMVAGTEVWSARMLVELSGASLLAVTFGVALVRDQRHNAGDEHRRTGTFRKASAP